MSIPHKQIRADEDRSWSLNLVDTIRKTYDDDDLDETVHTLQVLDDYRTVPLLLNLLEDKRIDRKHRTAASEILSQCNAADENEQTRRAWWASGDEILMRHAISTAERTESDIIEEVVGDANSPFYADAIRKLEVRFEEPRFQELKVSALSHPDEEVREIAAYGLGWDEPLIAEKPLLLSVEDRCDDVVTAALESLMYYHSQNVLLELSGLQKSCKNARKMEFQRAIENIRGDYLRVLQDLQEKSPAATAIFRAWLEPVWETLNFPRETKSKPDTASSARQADKATNAQTLAQVIARFDDPDGKWARRFEYVRTIDWQSFSEHDRTTLTKFFSSHPDWSVRDVSCEILAKWNKGKELLEYLDDPIFVIRKSAAYNIRDVSPDRRIAARLKDELENGCIASTHAYETLESYVVHNAEDENLNSYLEHLVIGDARESIRYHAISCLRKRSARSILQGLLSMLSDPPLVTWSVHHQLLQSCLELDLEIPKIDELISIDDLYIQSYLAQIAAKKSENEDLR